MKSYVDGPLHGVESVGSQKLRHSTTLDLRSRDAAATVAVAAQP